MPIYQHCLQIIKIITAVENRLHFLKVKVKKDGKRRKKAAVVFTLIRQLKNSFNGGNCAKNKKNTPLLNYLSVSGVHTFTLPKQGGVKIREKRKKCNGSGGDRKF